MLVEHAYCCGFCGEEIIVEIDISAGSQQEYVEDCPVCCHPHVLHVTIESDGRVTLNCETE